MTDKGIETICAFIVGMIGAVIFMLAEMIVWDVTDRPSVDLAWELRLTKYTAVHIVLAVLVNAIIIGGGLVGVWLVKG